MKTHRVTEYLPTFQPAYVSNGIIGLRVGKIPLPRGTALVNGFVGVGPEFNCEQIAEAPYPVGGDICVNGVWLSRRPYLATFRSQEYDFSCGELRSEFDFKAGDVTIRVEVLTFCSRTQPTLVMQEIAATADRACDLTLQGNVDPRGIMGKLDKVFAPGNETQFSAEQARDGILLWESRGGLGKLGVSYVTRFVGEDLKGRRRNNYCHEEDLQLTEYMVAAKPGRRYAVRQFTCVVPGIMHGEPHWQASRHAGLCASLGFDRLRKENRDAWSEIWKGQVRIIGADKKWQDVADAAYFYLHTSAHAACPISVAPFGLSQRTEYSGNVFWDMDTFMFPPMLLTAPNTARAMMDYRSRRLAAAQDNARLNGYRGAQFPVQSGVGGYEVAVFYAGLSGGTNEQHGNLDTAFAFAQFVHATNDETFLRQQAWPVLENVAEWIASRVIKTARGYEILNITGIDEGHDNVNNNAASNMAAIVVLREAVALSKRMGLPPQPSWVDIANNMYLPIDAATNVIQKHDGHRYDGGMYIPETMAAFFPYTYSHSPAVDKATAQLHMKLAHTSLGMPMLSTMFGVWAAREGERALAAEFFDRGIIAHLVEPFNQFNEIAPNIQDSCLGVGSGSTVFLTNPAGFIMALMYGLTGIQLDSGTPEQWGKFPIVMPERWDGIEVSRIWARGRQASLTAHHGDKRCKIEFL